MIIVNLMGGLGNQMFQYAYGYALEKRTGVPVGFSSDMFSAYNSHNGYELEQVFGLRPRLATRKDQREVVGQIWASPRARRIITNVPFLQLLSNQRIITEKKMKFDPDLLRALRKSYYVHGYFQSERYFSDCSDDIRRDYNFHKIEKSLVNETDQVSVSLHVRRGDYIDAKSVHAVCGPAYYKCAIDHVRKRVSNFQLVVFSDDPEWAEKEVRKLHHSYRVVTGNNGSNSYKDMFLISKCDHHIIANSSFSWWGAWLSQSKNKIVVAPKKWFSDSRLCDRNIVPDAWVRV